MRILYALLSCLVSSCVGSLTYVDYELWTLQEERQVVEMNTSVKPLLDGYYMIENNKKGFPPYFFLLEDGYWTTGGKWPSWGRYVIAVDSINIQYFRDTNQGLLPALIFRRWDLAVVSGKGFFLNDSTLAIYRRDEWCSIACGNRTGKTSEEFASPIIYKFVKSNLRPTGENPIKELNYTKSLQKISLFGVRVW